MSSEEVKPITVKKLPLILNRNIIIKKSMNRNIKVVKSIKSSVQEDIIYTSTLGDFTSGEVLNMSIVNRLNVLTKSSRTIARCQSHSGYVFEKNSDEITKLIGQNNYNILFSSLCSIINQELKIRSINALLTVPKKGSSVSCQTETNSMSFSVLRNVVDSSCQTDTEVVSDNILKNIEEFKRFPKPRKRNRKPQTSPYVVRDTPEVKQPRRIVISPAKFDSFSIKEEAVQKESAREPSLPELGSIFDEDSNNSVNSGRFSALSVMTSSDLLDNPMGILTNVDKHTRDISSEVNQREINARGRLHNLDNPGDLNPLDETVSFGMQEVLRRTPPEQRIKMLLRQGFTDLKDCLTRDSDGHLPIHVAVLTNDVDLLRRQCLVLKMRGASVDNPADGLTPLRMSLFQENTQITAILLHFGADPLDSDDEDRTPFHIASEMATDHLQILINYCQQNARKILQENEHLWDQAYTYKPDEELAPLLLAHINKLYDNQGYTPLMLASKLGKYNNVMTLVESCRATVNLAMPNSGNTALYLAVGAACMDAAERGNKAKIVDHFAKTVEILVENGADPGFDNFAGSSVNDLLTEFNIAELSMLIANKLTSIRYFDGKPPNGMPGRDYILFKDDEGKVNLRDLRDERKSLPRDLPKESSTKTPPVKMNVTKPIVTKTKTSPVIIENVEFKPAFKMTNPTATVSKSLIKHTVHIGPVNAQNSQPKNDPVKVTPIRTPSILKKYKLNKPLILSTQVTNNKRKLDTVVDSEITKKPNKND